MATPGNAVALERGDRIPSFSLPNHDGRGMTFYDMARGNPGLILIEAEKGGSTDREIDAIRDAKTQMEKAGLELFIVTRRNLKACQAFAATIDQPAPVLRDTAGQITAAFRAAAFQEGRGNTLFGLAYDSNQRILDTLVPGDISLIDQALCLVAREPSLARTEPIAGQAPVLIIPNLLSTVECETLTAYWQTTNTEGGVSGYQDGKFIDAKDISQKKRRDSLLDDKNLRNRVMGKIAKRLVSEMGKSFCYQDFILEPPLVACYEADRQDYFLRHRDNLSPQMATRRFALSLNLNDGYDGGALVFPEYGGQPYSPAGGAGIVFSCAHVHEALPVTRGERFVLLTFLHDPNRKPHPWSIPAQDGKKPS